MANWHRIGTEIFGVPVQGCKRITWFWTLALRLASNQIRLSGFFDGLAEHAIDAAGHFLILSRQQMHIGIERE